jgi:hypothetical protein
LERGAGARRRTTRTNFVMSVMEVL